MTEATNRVTAALAAHRVALAHVHALEDAPDRPAYDAAVEAESAAMMALARASCADDDEFFIKVAYIVECMDQEPSIDDGALAMAVRARLAERAA